MTIWIIATPRDVEMPFSFRLLPGNVKTLGRAARADFVVDAGMVCASTVGWRRARPIWK